MGFVELGVGCGGFNLAVAVVGLEFYRTGGAGGVFLLTVRTFFFARCGRVGGGGIETVDLRHASEHLPEEAVGGSGHSTDNFTGFVHASVSGKGADGHVGKVVVTVTRRETIHGCNSGDTQFSIFFHILVIIGSCLLVVALIGSA